MELGDRGKARLDEAAERFADARENMAGRAAEARETMAGRAADAREAMGDAAADAREKAAEAIARVKPRLRGVTHVYAFFVSLVLGAGLVLLADGAVAFTGSPRDCMRSPEMRSVYFGTARTEEAP